MLGNGINSNKRGFCETARQFLILQPIVQQGVASRVTLLSVLPSIACSFLPKLKEAKQPESYVLFIDFENETPAIRHLSSFFAWSFAPKQKTKRGKISTF